MSSGADGLLAWWAVAGCHLATSRSVNEPHAITAGPAMLRSRELSARPPANEHDRLVAPDLLRVLACFLVVLAHASSTYFFDFGSPSRHLWGNLYGSLARPSVPLFVILSGMLLLPVRATTGEFLRRRLGRIVLPLLSWGTLYALLGAVKAHASPGQALRGWASLLLNFPTEGLHLWYLYVLVGLYLFMPVLSPWLDRTSAREELGFLALWAASLCLPFLRRVSPALWGEAPWNDFGALHAFSGYAGYLVLGHFLARRVDALGRWVLPAAVAALLAIWLGTFAGQQLVYARHRGDAFSLWSFTSAHVALMAAALVVAARPLARPGHRIRAVLAELSARSFGIFLVHYGLVYGLQPWWDAAGVAPGLAIPLHTLLTFALSYAIVKLLARLPGSRWLLG